MDLVIAIVFLIMIAIVIRVFYQRIMNPSYHRKPNEVAEDTKQKVKGKIRKE